MSEQPQPQRMQQTMPEEDGGWHRVNAGPHLHIMFNPDRLGRQPDEIERPSIVVAVAGKQDRRSASIPSAREAIINPSEPACPADPPVG